jgi:nicotinamide-nucleotide amidase
MDESDNIEIDRRVKALSDHLLKANLIMATAESCTGGGIAQAMTALAGSSGWFDSGFVTYSNEAKQSMLDVPAVFFEPDGPGAVSEETVRAMVTGALRKSGADLAVAVSGVAGPGGGTASKPVGTVWIAWQLGADARARHFLFSGDREAVRQATILEALSGLLAYFSTEL